MAHKEMKKTEDTEILREQRNNLKESLINKKKELSNLLNSDLDLIDYILNVNYLEICDDKNIQPYFTKLVLERQKSVSDECFLKILLQFENIFINTTKITFNEEYLQLINLIKFFYCILNLEERNLNDDKIFVAINLISLDCHFYNENELLSKLNPISLSWLINEEIKEIFKKNIQRPISIEKLNNFVLSKKLELFLKYTNVFLSLDKDTLLSLNSYTRKLYSFIEEKELNLSNSEFLISDFFGELKNILINSKKDEVILALVFSHIMCYNLNLVNFVDINWFKEKESIYFIKWIEIYKEK